MEKTYAVYIDGIKTELPIIKMSEQVSIALLNMHGDTELTELCAAALAKRVSDCDVLLTAESKGLQLTHCIARNLGMARYAVARKQKKAYMPDCTETEIGSTVTTGKPQKLYLSRRDSELLRGKKVCIIDDVISTGASLAGMERLVELCGGTVEKRAFVLAEGDAAERDDVIYLDKIPLF